MKVKSNHIAEPGKIAGDTISRQAAIDALDCINGVEEVLRSLPPVQPKHGEWEYHSNPTIGINPETAYCSCCGFSVDTTGNIDFDEYNFCPRCGVDMRGAENGTD